MAENLHIIGPSSHTPPHYLDPVVETLSNRHFNVSINPQIYEIDGSYAGTIEQRIAAIHDAYQDHSIDMIMTARGGNGAVHLLGYLDYDLIKHNPKPFIGYSDTTVILNAIYAKTGQLTLHGPSAARFHAPLPTEQTDQCFDMLRGQYNDIKWNDCTVEQPFTASGTLIGGNLSAFQTLVGTPYNPINENEPYILFFEDYGDETSRYDRILGHLRQTGILDRAQAVLFGDFHTAEETGTTPFGKTTQQIINGLSHVIDTPLVTNCPFGHRGDLWTLPIGKHTRICADRAGLTLSFS